MKKNLVIFVVLLGICFFAGASMAETFSPRPGSISIDRSGNQAKVTIEGIGDVAQLEFYCPQAADGKFKKRFPLRSGGSVTLNTDEGWRIQLVDSSGRWMEIPFSQSVVKLRGVDIDCDSPDSQKYGCALRIIK